MRFNTCIFPFLPTSCPSTHLSILEAKSLSVEHPQKPSTTITVKHLAAGRPIFVFTNVTNPMEPHSFLPTNQIRALVKFILGGFARGKVLPHYLPLMNWKWLKSIIFCSLCLTVQLGNCLVKPQQLKSTFYVVVKYLLSEIELLQGNG